MGRSTPTVERSACGHFCWFSRITIPSTVNCVLLNNVSLQLSTALDWVANALQCPPLRVGRRGVNTRPSTASSDPPRRLRDIQRCPCSGDYSLRRSNLPLAPYPKRGSRARVHRIGHTGNSFHRSEHYPSDFARHPSPSFGIFSPPRASRDQSLRGLRKCSKATRTFKTSNRSATNVSDLGTDLLVHAWMTHNDGDQTIRCFVHDRDSLRTGLCCPAKAI